MKSKLAISQKLITGQRKTLQKHVTLPKMKAGPAIRSYTSQLSTDHNIDLHHQVKRSLQAKKMPFYIQFDYPDGRVDELQSRDYQNVLDALITKFRTPPKKTETM